jgi:hypothetical protein
MKNNINEAKVNKRQDISMTDNPVVIMKENLGLKNTPCAVCGGKCHPTGLDLFVAGTTKLICLNCVEKCDPRLYDTWFASRIYATALEGRVAADIRRKIQDIVNEPVEKRIFKLLNEMCDRGAVRFESCEEKNVTI